MLQELWGGPGTAELGEGRGGCGVIAPWTRPTLHSLGCHTPS